MNIQDATPQDVIKVLYEKGKVTLEEYDRGLDLLIEAKRKGYVIESRIIRSQKALSSRLRQDHSHAYVLWLLAYYYVQRESHE